MKSLITRATVVINNKWKPIYSTPDYMNYWFTSNDSDCFYMDRQDRRLMVIEVTGRPLGDGIYAKFGEWRDKQGGLAALLYHYLKEVDCAGFNPASRPPMTQAKQNMIERGFTPAENWAFGVKAQASLPPDERTLLTIKEGDPVYELYTIKELMQFAATHTAAEDLKWITTKTVGQALEKAGYRKVRCAEYGRLKLKGVGFEYVWVLGKVEQLGAERDPEVIRARYFEPRPTLTPFRQPVPPSQSFGNVSKAPERRKR